jgi:ABC-2 type transport system permease protein
MNADGMAHRVHGNARHTNDERLWSQIPDFVYTSPAIATPSMPAGPAFGALLIWLGIAATWLTITARELRP